MLSSETVRPMVDLIAFTGHARVGKDTAAEALEPLGYQRVAFGKLIKQRLDAPILESCGFSAFTEDDAQKQHIRPLLETFGEVAYDSIMQEFFRTLPKRAVNCRLVRTKEAIEWVKRGGVIVEIRRPGKGPATKWEEERLKELREAGLIDYVIEASTVPELKEKIVQYATGARAS